MYLEHDFSYSFLYKVQQLSWVIFVINARADNMKKKLFIFVYI